MPDHVRITDVAPRDGLQNEAGAVTTADKADLVRTLAQTGVAEVEVTSFVNPKVIPQLADAADLLAAVAQDKPAGTRFSVLVPNAKGMDRAIAANNAAAGNSSAPLIDKAAVFAAASETFSEKNTGGSIEEVLERFPPVIDTAHEHGMTVRGYISCIVACPYEGPIDPERVADVASTLIDMGADEIDLGDTIGEGTAETIANVLLAVIERLDGRRTNDRGEPILTLHLHDTFGRAAECVTEALTLGVRSFDGAVSGLGGCPFASTPDRRAPGNIDTGLLVNTIHAAGFETSVDKAKLAHASAVASRVVAAARANAAGDS